MRLYPSYMLKYEVAQNMRRYALRGFYRGTSNPEEQTYFCRCQGGYEADGSVLIFTRDVGMHSSGWWKNPDYERCWHLSISFRDPITGIFVGQDHRKAKEWCEAFFGTDCDKLWIEPPYSAQGKASDVWHYRLFVDPAWQPIIPRGEVYSKEFTEAGWKSWSDVHAAEEAVHG